VCKHFWNSALVQIAIGIIINPHHRRHAAAPHAAHFLQGEHPVIRGALACLKPEVAADLVQYVFAIFNMAGSAQADAHQIFAPRRKAE